MKDAKKISRPVQKNSDADIEKLLAEYNKQIKKSSRHSYSETLHNDDSSGCCLCDLCSCGCDTVACLANGC